MIRIAVLMACYNRATCTLRCLGQLFEQEKTAGISLEVWLVDDNSSDGTAEKVRTRYPAVHVIKSKGNLFWCRSMRLAWQSALESGICYDFYLWLNDDVWLKKIAVWRLLEDYQLSAEVNAVIVGTLSSDKSEQVVAYGAKMSNGVKPFPNGIAPQMCDGTINGNIVLIPRRVYEMVGMIYGRYLHGYGDYDYGYVLKEHGIPFFASSAFVGDCKHEPERYSNLKGRNLIGRLALLLDPKGYNLHDTFIFRYRHWGFFRAILSCFHVIFFVALGMKDVRVNDREVSR